MNHCCCGESLRWTGRRYYFSGPYQIVECLACGVRRTWPTPTPKELVQAYRTHPAYAPQDGATPAQHGSGWRRIWVLPDLPVSSRVLDLGAGSGRFADWARRERGWLVTSVDGMGAAEAFTAEPGTFDLVVAWQALEHFLDPVAVLSRARTWLRPGGRLVVSVPNVRSLERAWFGTEWSGWHLPCHLWHFSPTTLRRTIGGAGFRVDRILHQRQFKGAREPLATLLGALTAALHCSGRITAMATRP